MNQTTLAPTLWRTCRVLACPRRLKILAAVVEKGPVCVKDVARICRMPANTATQYLRALQARGILAANRQSRWVYYVPRADPSVQHAKPMLLAMQKAFARDESFEAMVAVLTAFTHPRRIAIARRLAAGPALVEKLAHDTGISLPACYRHLSKLQSRAVVVIGADGTCQLVHSAPGLATALLHAALE
jgi:DNA-binding transcriptional ArsR family regulator